jgi:hypothetical protein
MADEEEKVTVEAADAATYDNKSSVYYKKFNGDFKNS